MKHIDFYFDPISPYAYLAFEQLPKALQGLSYSVSYRPVLFAAMLKHFGQLGPAEIMPKRTWTYRQIEWLARQMEVELQFPAAHPFNSVHLLRLALACGEAGQCNRYVAARLLEHVWRSGQSADDLGRLQKLIEELLPPRKYDSPCVKAELRANTETAISQDVFGVPMMRIEEQNFWGLDSLSMVRSYLQGDDWFASDKWMRLNEIPASVVRAGSVSTASIQGKFLSG